MDAKKGALEREELERADPEAVAALEAEEARLLAKERMHLKHRAGKGIGGSKWVKRVLAKGGGSGQQAGSKEAMVAHLKAAQVRQLLVL